MVLVDRWIFDTLQFKAGLVTASSSEKKKLRVIERGDRCQSMSKIVPFRNLEIGAGVVFKAADPDDFSVQKSRLSVKATNERKAGHGRFSVKCSGLHISVMRIE